MSFCPNCSAKLQDSEPVCWNCSAEFGTGSTWQPTKRPLGKFRKVAHTIPASLGVDDSQPAISTGAMIFRMIVAAPLFIAGCGLLVLALSQLGPLTGIPGLLCIAAACGVIGARSTGASIAAFVFAGLLCFLLFGGLQLLGAAIYSR